MVILISQSIVKEIYWMIPVTGSYYLNHTKYQNGLKTVGLSVSNHNRFKSDAKNKIQTINERASVISTATENSQYYPHNALRVSRGFVLGRLANI